VKAWKEEHRKWKVWQGNQPQHEDGECSGEEKEREADGPERMVEMRMEGSGVSVACEEE
jgi:hypothetical protein